jgi:hypothetical protein
MSLWRKVGGFFIGLGIFLLILFVISDSVRQPEFGLLAGGFGCIALGGFISATHPAPEPPPSPRFRIIKRRKKDEPKPRREQKANEPDTDKEEGGRSR